MDINKYRIAYATQKSRAAARGIEFLLTFKEWCDFWGSDIDRRGSGKDDLQMQRFADTGPYAIWNIRKGTPKQNAITAGHMKRKRASEVAAAKLQAELDAAMNEPSAEPYDDVEDELELYKFSVKSSFQGRYNYKR